MRAIFTTLAAVALAGVCAAPAQAEKWLWFPVKGGAIAYDDDSRKSDLKEGHIAANTLIYYDKARSAGAGSYSFVAERLEFECRGARHRWSQSAVLDTEGRVVVARDDGDWTPLGTDMGSTALFKRILCLADSPPGVKTATDFEKVLAAMAGRQTIAAVETAKTIPVPAASPPPAPAPAAKVAAPAPPPVVARAEIPAAAPSRPVPPLEAKTSLPVPVRQVATANAAPEITTLPASPVPKAPAPKAAAPALPAPSPAVALRPSVSPVRADLAADPKCVIFKQGTNLVWAAVNSCSFTVNYAWCVNGGGSSAYECQAPAYVRGAGTVPARGQAASSYQGALGQKRIFVCRAPGKPVVRETAPQRYDYDCTD